uniref:Uncharacterized protein LOC114346258 n=1 Tax=Diabrotica virgifera virgifera TaxID=50390 RepID=A0A6P7H2U2_DIAVI
MVVSHLIHCVCYRVIMYGKKPLSERELEELAANFWNSDDDLDNSDSEECFRDETNLDPDEIIDIQSLPVEFEDGVTVTEFPDQPIEPIEEPTIVDVDVEVEPITNRIKNIVWKKKTYPLMK